jgi:hypothetical protein
MEPTPTLIAVPWKPSVATSVWMTVAGTVIALVAGVLAFVLAFRGREGTITFDPAGVVIAVVINGVLVAGLLSSIAGWVVLPFAVHIAGCIGDWFLIAVALRAPRGSLVEDMKDGLVVYTVAP